MAGSAAIVLGWEILDAAMVWGKSGGPGAGMRIREKNESGLRACFFYCWRVLGTGYGCWRE